MPDAPLVQNRKFTVLLTGRSWEKYFPVLFWSQFLSNIEWMLRKKKKELPRHTKLVKVYWLAYYRKPVSLCNSHDNRVPGESFSSNQNVILENCCSPAGSSDVSYSRGVKLGQTVCQLSFNASTNQQSPSIGRGLRSQPIRTISRFVGQPMGGV